VRTTRYGYAMAELLGLRGTSSIDAMLSAGVLPPVNQP
jgi:hypothetical protein